MKIIRAYFCAWCGNVLFDTELLFLVRIRGVPFMCCPNAVCPNELKEAQEHARLIADRYMKTEDKMN